jgi:hypothetical protein
MVIYHALLSRMIEPKCSQGCIIAQEYSYEDAYTSRKLFERCDTRRNYVRIPSGRPLRDVKMKLPFSISAGKASWFLDAEASGAATSTRKTRAPRKLSMSAVDYAQMLQQQLLRNNIGTRYQCPWPNFQATLHCESGFSKCFLEVYAPS